MRECDFCDSDGKKFKVLIPDGAPDSAASMGIVVGPPSLESLGMPKEMEVRLHNGLYDRGLIRSADVSGRQMDVFSAIQHALGVDVGRILDLYKEMTEHG